MCILHFQLIDLDLWNIFCEVSPWGNFLFTLQRQNKVSNPGDEAMIMRNFLLVYQLTYIFCHIKTTSLKAKFQFLEKYDFIWNQM